MGNRPSLFLAFVLGFPTRDELERFAPFLLVRYVLSPMPPEIVLGRVPVAPLVLHRPARPKMRPPCAAPCRDSRGGEPPMPAGQRRAEAPSASAPSRMESHCWQACGDQIRLIPEF